MKKVLIITYYWPPGSGAGVQRWLKFVKYLRQFGWEPVIYTPENPETPGTDSSFLKDIPDGVEIIRKKINEPYNAYRIFTGKSKKEKIKSTFVDTSEKKNSLLHDISIWIRGNLFIPDARKFWIRPSVRFLSKLLREQKFDVIVSSGPPHSMHLIPLKLISEFNIPWIADFRDPWTDIEFFDFLKLTKYAYRKHKKLERKVIKSANMVLSVSWSWAEIYRSFGARQVQVITNGYDKDDFYALKEDEAKQFNLLHVGALSELRNPHLFWKALTQVAIENPDFTKDIKITFVGDVDVKVVKQLKSLGLAENVNYVGHVNHNEIINYSEKASCLLLPLSNGKSSMGLIPGKLFEYLAMKKPIIGIGPVDGDSAKILKDTDSGVMIDFTALEEMKKQIRFFYQQYRNNKLQHFFTFIGIENYSRKLLTKQLSNVFNSLIERDPFSK